MKKFIDGKSIANEINELTKKEIREKKLTVGLAVILIGSDPASEIYVKLKKKACQDTDIDFSLYKMDIDTTEEKIIEVINFLNSDDQINAILIQLPLPTGFDENKIISAIDPTKDVDGFHPKNIEAFMNNGSHFIPPLAEGIDILLKSINENLQYKKMVILANSDEFSKPLEKYFTDQGLLVSHTHLTSNDWSIKTREADILITAVGSPLLIKADNIKPDAIIIDVGTNRIAKDVIVGDVDFDDIQEKCSYITPVPGGVGPMTIAMLLKNCVRLAQK